MISKNSSPKKLMFFDFVQTLKANLGILALGLVIFIILIPVSIAAIPESSIFNVDFTHQQLMFRFFDPDYALFINITAIIFGLVLGLKLARFMLTKKESSFYFSIGLKRKNLFLNRFIVGFILLIIIIFLPLTIALILNIVALGAYTNLLYSFWALGFGLLLQGLISMCLAFLACALMGTLLEATLLTGAFLFTPMSVFYTISTLCKQYLFGSPWGAFTYALNEVEPSLLSLLAKFNPLTFFIDGLNKHSEFWLDVNQIDKVVPAINIKLLLMWGLVTLFLIIIADLAIKYRKAEIAEIAGLKPGLSHYICFIASLGISAVLISFLKVLNGFLPLLLGLVGFILTYIILYKTVLKSIGSKKQSICQFVGQLVAVIIIVLIVKGGAFGYSDRVPESDKIANVKISYIGSPNYISTPTEGSSTGKSYYLVRNMSFEKKQDITMIKAIHQKIIELGPLNLKQDEENFSQTVIPYDIKIAYTLHGGKQIVRYYNKASLELLSAMLDLDNSKTIKDNMIRTVKGETDKSLGTAAAYANGEVYFSDPYYIAPKNIKFDSKKRQELLDALAKDINNQTVEQRYFPNRKNWGLIMFTLNGEDDTNSFAYNMANALVFLNDDFMATKNLLEQWDILNLFNEKATIESITLQKFLPYSSINKLSEPISPYFLGYQSEMPNDFIIEQDFGNLPEITDQKQIAAIEPLLQSCYFMNDGGYLVAIKTKEKAEWIYRYLPNDAMQKIKQN